MANAIPQSQKPRGFGETVKGVFKVGKNLMKPGINRDKLEVGAAVATENPTMILGAVQNSAASAIEAERQKEAQKAQEKYDREKLKSLRDAGKSVGGPGGGSSGGAEPKTGWLMFLFFIAALTHIFDIIWKYQDFDKVIIAVYVGIIIFGLAFALKGTGRSKEGTFFFVVVGAYFLPRIVVWIASAAWQTIILGVLFWLPVLPLYLALVVAPEGTGLKRIGKFYAVIWIIIMIIFAVVYFGQDIKSTGTGTKVNVLDGAKMVWTGIANSFSKFGKMLTTSIQTATCPDCGGQQESERGIFLEDVRATDSTYYVGSDVFVQAKIRAKNINGTIKVNTICFVPGEKQGNVTPATLQLNYNDENYIDCDLGNLAAGSKEVRFASSFEFETDAEITYTFMDTKTLNALNMQNNELYQKLNIPETAQAIYTGGPVQVGLPQLHQPFRIDSVNPNSITYPFGVSLTNSWTQGKIVKGLYYRLEVPSSITLKDCNRKISKYEQANDKNIYTFSIDDANARETFDSVACRMYLVDVNKLLGSDIKSVKTFNAKVRYLYSVEASTFVNIEKI